MIDIKVVAVNTLDLKRKEKITKHYRFGKITERTFPSFNDILSALMTHLESVYNKLIAENPQAHIIFNLQEYALSDGGVRVPPANEKHEYNFLNPAQKATAIRTIEAFTLEKNCHVFLPISHNKKVVSQEKLDTLIDRRRTGYGTIFGDKEVWLLNQKDYNRFSPRLSDNHRPLVQTRNTVYLIGEGKKLGKQDKTFPYFYDVCRLAKVQGTVSIFRPAKDYKAFKLNVFGQTLTVIHESCLDHVFGLANTKKLNGDLHLISSATCSTYTENMQAPFLVHTDYIKNSEACYRYQVETGDNQPLFNIRAYRAPYPSDECSDKDAQLSVLSPSMV